MHFLRTLSLVPFLVALALGGCAGSAASDGEVLAAELESVNVDAATWQCTCNSPGGVSVEQCVAAFPRGEFTDDERDCVADVFDDYPTYRARVECQVEVDREFNACVGMDCNADGPLFCGPAWREGYAACPADELEEVHAQAYDGCLGE